MLSVMVAGVHRAEAGTEFSLNVGGNMSEAIQPKVLFVALSRWARTRITFRAK